MKLEDIKEVNSPDDLKQLKKGDVFSIGVNHFIAVSPLERRGPKNLLSVTVKKFLPPLEDGPDGVAIGLEYEVNEENIHLWQR